MSWDNRTGWWVAGVPYVMGTGSKRERKYIIGTNEKTQKLFSDTHLQLKTCNLEKLTAYFHYQNIPPVLTEKGTTVCINGIPVMIVENQGIPTNDATFFERARKNILKDLLVKNATTEPIFSKTGMNPAIPSSTKKEQEKFFETSSHLEGSGMLSSIAKKYNALIENHGKGNVWAAIAAAATSAGMTGAVMVGTVPAGTFIIAYIIVTMLPAIIYMAADVLRLLNTNVFKPVVNLLKLVVLPILAICDALTEMLHAYRNGKTVSSGIWDAMKTALSKLKSAFVNIIPLLLKFSQNLAVLMNIKNCFYASGQPLGPIYSGNIKEFGKKLKSAGERAMRLATNFSETVASIGTFTLKSSHIAFMGFKKGAITLLRKFADNIARRSPVFGATLQSWSNGLTNLEKYYGEQISNQSKEILQIYPTVKSVLDWTNYLITSPASLFLLSQSILFFFGGWLPLSIVAILGMVQVSYLGVAGMFFVMLVLQKCMSTLWNYIMYYACVKENCGQDEDTSYRDLGTSICMSDCWNAGTEGLSSLHLPPGVLGELHGLNFGPLEAYKSTIITTVDGINSYQTGTMGHFLSGQFRVNVYDTYAKAVVERAYEVSVRPRVDSAQLYAANIASNATAGIQSYLDSAQLYAANATGTGIGENATGMGIGENATGMGIGENATGTGIGGYLSSAYDLGCTVIRSPFDGTVWVIDKAGNITSSIHDNIPSLSLDPIRKLIWPEYYRDAGSGFTTIATPEQMKEIEDAKDKILRRTNDELKIILTEEGKIMDDLWQSFWDAIRKDNSKSEANPNINPLKTSTVTMEEAQRMSKNPTTQNRIMPLPQTRGMSYVNFLAMDYFYETTNISKTTPSLNIDLVPPQQFNDLPEEMQNTVKFLFYEAYDAHLKEMTPLYREEMSGDKFGIIQNEKTMELVDEIMSKYDAFEKKREAADQRRRDAAKEAGESMYKFLVDLAEQEYDKKGSVSKIYTHPSLTPPASSDAKPSKSSSTGGWWEYFFGKPTTTPEENPSEVKIQPNITNIPEAKPLPEIYDSNNQSTKPQQPSPPPNDNANALSPIIQNPLVVFNTNTSSNYQSNFSLPSDLNTNTSLNYQSNFSLPSDLNTNTSSNYQSNFSLPSELHITPAPTTPAPTTPAPAPTTPAPAPTTPAPAPTTPTTPEFCNDIRKRDPRRYKKSYNDTPNPLEIQYDHMSPSDLRKNLINMYDHKHTRNFIPINYLDEAEYLYKNRDCLGEDDATKTSISPPLTPQGPTLTHGTNESSDTQTTQINQESTSILTNSSPLYPYFSHVTNAPESILQFEEGVGRLINDCEADVYISDSRNYGNGGLCHPKSLHDLKQLAQIKNTCISRNPKDSPHCSSFIGGLYDDVAKKGTWSNVPGGKELIEKIVKV